MRDTEGVEEDEDDEEDGQDEEDPDFLDEIDSTGDETNGVEAQGLDQDSAPTLVYKPVRRNQFKMPDYTEFETMEEASRKFIYKKGRFIQARQLHLIAALQQQLNAERTANALLQSDSESTYRLDVDTPYDKCEFPREIGDGQGSAMQSRIDSDWVVLRRTKQRFDLKIVTIDKDGNCSTADPYLGTDSGDKPLPLKITLCDDMGNKIESPFLSLGNTSGDVVSNELTVNMTTNVAHVSLMIKATSSFLRSMGIGKGKVLLKFETTFGDKHLEFKTRPFHVTIRVSAGKAGVEPWSPDTLNAVCDECAHCSKRLKTGRIVHQ